MNKDDEFDNRFGFILKYGIDNKQNYNLAKAYFRNLPIRGGLNVCSKKDVSE